MNKNSFFRTVDTEMAMNYEVNGIKVTSPCEGLMHVRAQSCEEKNCITHRVLMHNLQHQHHASHVGKHCRRNLLAANGG